MFLIIFWIDVNIENMKKRCLFFVFRSQVWFFLLIVMMFLVLFYFWFFSVFSLEVVDFIKKSVLVFDV